MRFNARARDYHNRNPEDNNKDGTEFTSFGPKEVGREFDRVADLKAGRKQELWAVLGLKDRQNMVARFDGKAWTTLILPGESVKVTCVAEIRPDVILVGVNFVGPAERDERQSSLFEVDWKSRKVAEVAGPQGVFEIIALPDGRVFAISWSGLFERNGTR